MCFARDALRYVMGFGVVRLMLTPVHAVLRHECVLPEMFYVIYVMGFGIYSTFHVNLHLG